jgi:GTP cyclohydrolase II
MNKPGATEDALKPAAEARFPTQFGEFRIFGFAQGGEELVVLTMGELSGEPPLVRIHSQCLTGDVFHSLRCDCRQQLEIALYLVAKAGRGVILYEMKEGRGIGIINKLRAYELQDGGLDTVEANVELGLGIDLRDYRMPALALRYFGLNAVKLLSNNPEKIAAMEAAGIAVVERVPCLAEPGEMARYYLQVKRDKLGHLLD